MIAQKNPTDPRTEAFDSGYGTGFFAGFWIGVLVVVFGLYLLA
jgi:hypothetical protein